MLAILVPLAQVLMLVALHQQHGPENVVSLVPLVILVLLVQVQLLVPLHQQHGLTNVA